VKRNKQLVTAEEKKKVSLEKSISQTRDQITSLVCALLLFMLVACCALHISHALCPAR
jgi:hypothetical protein